MIKKYNKFKKDNEISRTNEELGGIIGKDPSMDDTQKEMLNEIKRLEIDCPECINMDDDQYTCTTCWYQGGNGRVNVFNWLKEHPIAFQHYIKEGLFSKSKKDPVVKEIEEKISDAAFSLKTFGTTNPGAFVNGAKWAIHNLTNEEIDIIRNNTDKDDFSFFGL